MKIHFQNNKMYNKISKEKKTWKEKITTGKNNPHLRKKIINWQNLTQM